MIRVNSLPTGDVFCHLLITPTNSSDPEQLIWIQTVRPSDGIPEIFFEKGDFEKKSANSKKAYKMTWHAKSIYF